MPSKHQPIVAPISEKRILQLSNDVSEDMASGTVREWRAVAVYFRNLFDQHNQKLVSLRSSVSSMMIGDELKKTAESEIKEWLSTQKQNESSHS